MKTHGSTLAGTLGTIGASIFYDKYVRPWKDGDRPPWFHHHPQKDPRNPFPKKKKEKMNKEDFPVGLSKTFKKYHVPNPPLRGMLKHHITYRDSFVATQTWLSGYKKYWVPAYIGTTSQFLTGTSNGTSANRDQVSYASFFDLNPTQGIATGNIVTTIPAPNNDKMGIASAQIYMDVKNVTNMPAFVKIHLYVAETDTSIGPLLSYSNALTADALYSPNYVFGASTTALPASSGNEICSFGAATTSVNENMTSIPYTNLLAKRLTRSLWKRIKTHSITLSGADQQEICFTGIHNQFGLRERLNSLAVTFPKGCLAVVMEAQGACVQDTVNANYTHGAGKIVCLITRKIHLAPMKTNNARFETTYVGAGQEMQNQTLPNDKDVTFSTVGAQTGIST